MRKNNRFVALAWAMGITSGFASDWWFAVGVNQRGMDVEIEGSTYSQDLGLSGANPGTRYGAPLTTNQETGRSDSVSESGRRSSSRTPDIGDENTFGDRTYDDGYVRLDPGTGDPLSLEPGLTWNWGYDDGSQTSGQSLLFTATEINESAFNRTTTTTVRELATLTQRGERIRVSTVEDRPIRLSDEISGVGLSAEAGYFLSKKENGSLSLVVGLNTAWGAESHRQDTPFRQRIMRQQLERIQRTPSSYEIIRSDHIQVNGSQVITDSYALQGVLPPSAPYRGNFNGPGPTIPNRPTSRGTTASGTGEEQTLNSRTNRGRSSSSQPVVTERVISSEQYDAFAVVDFDLDADVYELLIGPRIHLSLQRGMSVYASPYISMNMIDYSATRNEQFVINRDGKTTVVESWQDRASDIKALFGYGAQVGLQIPLKDNWFLIADGAYTHVPDDVSIPIGPNTIHIDPSSYSARLMVGRRFGATTATGKSKE